MQQLNYYTYGQLIEVRDSNINSWTKERFLCFSIKGFVVTEDEDGGVSVWLQHRNLAEEVELTIKDIADKFGVKEEQIKIKK
jgi:hypothetical protein